MSKTSKQTQQPHEKAHFSPIHVQKCLKGVNYPADRSTLIDQASRQGGDDEVMNFLHSLPEDHEFSSPADVMRFFGENTQKSAS